jgi:hypothetical protein
LTYPGEDELRIWEVENWKNERREELGGWKNGKRRIGRGYSEKCVRGYSEKCVKLRIDKKINLTL